MFAIWIRATLMRKPEYGIVLPQVHDLQELNVMLAEKLEEWAHGYKAEGVQEGIERGKAKGVQVGEMLSLQKLLSKRFGAIPTEITARISAAGLDETERWFDRAIDAVQLSDIFDKD
jgi:flagellar biosynthesis/type III secretory pathway protein FliH